MEMTLAGLAGAALGGWKRAAERGRNPGEQLERNPARPVRSQESREARVR